MHIPWSVAAAAAAVVQRACSACLWHPVRPPGTGWADMSSPRHSIAARAVRHVMGVAHGSTTATVYHVEASLLVDLRT